MSKTKCTRPDILEQKQNQEKEWVNKTKTNCISVRPKPNPNLNIQEQEQVQDQDWPRLGLALLITIYVKQNFSIYGNIYLVLKEKFNRSSINAIVCSNNWILVYIFSLQDS